ncbi:hypothetical protein [Streptomyces sp. NPDC127190]|uniref:hypothetical protein n=1 Tax=unclassified Streptomyces TaxID=2593676 RepID=UPI0036373DF1
MNAPISPVPPIPGDGCTAVAVDICPGAECTGRRAAGESGRLLSGGRRLCQVCLQRLSRDLSRLPALHEACGRRLDGGNPDPTRPKTSGGPLPSAAFNHQAAEVRTEILGVLGSWAGAVVAERGARPAPRRAVLPLAVFLGRNLDWLAGHAAAGEFSCEIARLVRRARQVVDPEVRQQLLIGACVEQDCPGKLTAVVRPQAPRIPAVIRCSHSPAHRWHGHEWLQLSRRLRGAATAGTPRAHAPEVAAEAPSAGAVRWMTAADVSGLWGIPTGSVYRHASQSKWRRRSGQGRTYYHSQDVERTLSGRV